MDLLYQQFYTGSDNLPTSEEQEFMKNLFTSETYVKNEYRYYHITKKGDLFFKNSYMYYIISQWVRNFLNKSRPIKINFFLFFYFLESYYAKRFCWWNTFVPKNQAKWSNWFVCFDFDWGICFGGKMVIWEVWDLNVVYVFFLQKNSYLFV